MKKFLVILFCFAFLSTAGSAAAANRYVATTGSDSNSCAQSTSQSTPKLTLDSAIACMSSTDILEVKAGTYAMPTTMPPSGSSFAAATIIRRFGSDVVTVTATGTGMTIASRSYIIWDGINVDARTVTDQAIWLGGSNHIRITNSEIYGTNGVTAFGILDGEGNTGFNEIISNVFHNFGFEFTHHALYFGTPSNVFEYNEFYSIAGSCLQLYTGSGNTTDTSNNTFRFNTCRDSNGTNKGTSLSAGIFAWDGSNTKIYANKFINLDGVGINLRGTGLEVQQNTMYRLKDSAMHIGALGDGGHKVQNNIFWDICYPSGICEYPNRIYGPGDASTGSTKSNNLCDAAETGCSVLTNPLFADAPNNDFRLCTGSGAPHASCTGTSPAIDAGATLGSPYNVDFAGTSRPQGAAYDIGAYESGGTPGPSCPSTPALVAAYSFDGVATDSSGNANHGSLGTGVTYAAGKYGQAASFAGTGAITVPDATSLFLCTGFTLSAWVKPSNAPTTWTAVIVKNYRYYLYSEGEPGNGPAGGYNQGGDVYAQYGTALTQDVWKYLTVTYDGTTLRLYLDAVLVTSQAATAILDDTTGTMMIGGSEFNEFFQGLIDEVRVYNYPRSATLTSTDMNTPIGAASNAVIMNISGGILNFGSDITGINVGLIP